MGSSRVWIYVLCALAVCVTLGVAQPSSGRTAAGGPEWLPLKGTFKNAIGCTWNNGCNDPSAGYHGYPAIDFMVGAGVEVFAAGPGEVEVSYRGCAEGNHACGPNNSRFGNSVGIRHDDGRWSWYAHLSEVYVDEDTRVAAGDVIGRTGNTGYSLGAHLHYEERQSSPNPEYGFGARVSPGPMLAYHGSRLVSYPGALKFGDWNVVPCGKQPGESCAASHTVRNDGYSAQQATAPKPKPGVCTPQPMGVVFVIDDSGSNSETDPRYLRADAARVALDILPDGTLVSAVNFASSAVTMLNTRRLTDANRDSIADQIRSSLRTAGGTNYESAFRQAVVELGRMRGVQRIVIFLSDGKPTSGYSTDRSIGAQRIPIHTVGYGPVRNLPVLIDIARNSGASYQPIENVAEASNAFATIVHPYQCNKAIGGANLTLRPNKEYKRSFNVARGAPGISALATWTHHDAPDVWLRRPDGTLIRPGDARRAGESIKRPGQQVIKFDVSLPPAGKWTLIARSRRWVSLAFDLWKTQKPLVLDQCPNVLVLGSRGSGQAPGLGSPVSFFASALRHRLESAATKKTVHVYPNPYPAAGGNFNVLTAALKIPHLGAYHDSVVEGKNWLTDAVNWMVRNCGSTKLVLVGYSQGAHVTGDVVASLGPGVRKHILATVLFGDPKFNSADANAKRGDSPTGFNGSLGTRTKLTGRVLSYCRKGDVVCASRLVGEALVDKFIVARDAHGRYDEWAPAAAEAVADAAR